ncbi:hypothetical protein A3Q56_02419 [Intoshia linei]|uniref:DNA polymerase n=1 Tax=Intoshia linei TaxID=1819745 RepID=A0A177B818_9BILA|nr:hypothetical protein A3Q56_02419 [Intoshia linei]
MNVLNQNLVISVFVVEPYICSFNRTLDNENFIQDPGGNVFNPQSNLYVPIIKIFGSTCLDEKVCINIHNSYPYCYLLCEGDLLNDLILKDRKCNEKYINKLLKNLNEGLYHVRREEMEKSGYRKKLQLISLFSIQCVEGKNIYGYSNKNDLFLKLCFKDPSDVKLINIVLSKSEMIPENYKLFETHIPFCLQFMIDNKVRGMTWLEVQNARKKEWENNILEYDIKVSDILGFEGEYFDSIWDAEKLRRISQKMKPPQIDKLFTNTIRNFDPSLISSFKMQNQLSLIFKNQILETSDSESVGTETSILSFNNSQDCNLTRLIQEIEKNTDCTNSDTENVISYQDDENDQNDFNTTMYEIESSFSGNVKAQLESIKTEFKASDIFESDVRSNLIHFTPSILPPSKSELLLQRSQNSERSHPNVKMADMTLGFAENSFKNVFEQSYTETNTKLLSPLSNLTFNNLSILSFEILTQCKVGFCPNYKCDEIILIACTFVKSIIYFDHDDESQCKDKNVDGAIFTDFFINTLDFNQDLLKFVLKKDSNVDNLENNCSVFYYKNEIDVLFEFIQHVNRLNPDILLTYLVEKQSLHYLIHRCEYVGIEFCKKISRITDDEEHFVGSYNKYRILGRFVMNLWRHLQNNLTLGSYTFENVVHHLFKKRISFYSYSTLASNFIKSPKNMYDTLEYYKMRICGNVKICLKTDLIQKISNLASISGIEFENVLLRGSMYRCESYLQRLCKKDNYFCLSPSGKDIIGSDPLSHIPLTLQPFSGFYTNPVIVLDYQSLYPSIIIAYNICYSTCIGKFKNLFSNQICKFGSGKYKFDFSWLKDATDLYFAPNRVGFVSKNVRAGLLPKMLEQLISTRIMVKESMKMHTSKKLIDLLDSIQRALKMIANTTYGYTAASFSGRMPCVDIAEAVISQGREILEITIRKIEESGKWNAKVVYGDTDSVFLEFPGKTCVEAEEIGQEIVKSISNLFPAPIKLKFEKVYTCCLLLTMKRYAGLIYNEDGQDCFEAKGIETIRRDSCLVVSQILEKSLKYLFKHPFEIMELRSYIKKQIKRIYYGRIGLEYFIFAKEFRGRNSYRKFSCVPSLKIVKYNILYLSNSPILKKKLEKDCNDFTPNNWRVPYVIMSGLSTDTLISLVRDPLDLLESGESLNVNYYVLRHVLPALHRCFSFVDININLLLNTIQRPQKMYTNYSKNSIERYMNVNQCLLCRGVCKNFICVKCEENRPIESNTAILLKKKFTINQQQYVKKDNNEIITKFDIIDMRQTFAIRNRTIIVAQEIEYGDNNVLYVSFKREKYVKKLYINDQHYVNFKLINFNYKIYQNDVIHVHSLDHLYFTLVILTLNKLMYISYNYGDTWRPLKLNGHVHLDKIKDYYNEFGVIILILQNYITFTSTSRNHYSSFDGGATWINQFNVAIIEIIIIKMNRYHISLAYNYDKMWISLNGHRNWSIIKRSHSMVNHFSLLNRVVIGNDQNYLSIYYISLASFYVSKFSFNYKPYHCNTFKLHQSLIYGITYVTKINSKYAECYITDD